MKCPQCKALMDVVEIDDWLDNRTDWQVCALHCFLCGKVLSPAIRAEFVWTIGTHQTQRPLGAELARHSATRLPSKVWLYLCQWIQRLVPNPFHELPSRGYSSRGGNQSVQPRTR
jgi:hypothetical protein